MKGHLRRAGLRSLGRLTVSAALVASRHFFVAPLASRTTQYAASPSERNVSLTAPRNRAVRFPRSSTSSLATHLEILKWRKSPKGASGVP
jgi:hypothetical protein